MNKLYIHSLFASYVNCVPSGERIPYTRGDQLTRELVERLTAQILSGQVSSIQLEDESQETSLAADFRDGWATVYIVKDCEHYFELVNSQCPNCETPLNITGDGPTPQKHATQDMQLMTNIISYFAETGEVYPDCMWEHTIH